MKAMKWAVVLMLILLGGCANTAAEITPPEEEPVEQQPAAQQPVTQNAAAPAVPEPVKSPLKIIGLRAEPNVVDINAPAVVIVSVNNTGKEFGTFPVELMIDGSLYSRQTVSLPAGTASNLTFNVIPINERNLLITAGDLFCELIVQHS